MRLLYALPIVLLPNALHLPPDLGVGASIVLLIVAFVFSQRDPPQLAQTGYLTPPLVGLFLALLLGYITAQWDDVSNAGEDLLRAKYAIIYPLLYIAYRRCGLDLKATKQLIVLVMMVAAVAGLEAVFQGLQFNLGAFDYNQRATGPFGEINAANRAGVFFAMFLPMFVAVALQPNHRKLTRWLAVAGGAILVAAILFTFSRQSYLIALLGILLLLVHRGASGAVLAVLLIMIGVGLLPDSVIQRMQETRQLDAGGMASYDVSTISRLELWKGAFAMLADHPGGVGLGRFGDYIGNYTNYPGRDAHNGFVLVLAECGPLGLAMMLWLFWRLWGLARKLRRSAGSNLPEARAFSLGFTVAVISMALGNVYGSPYFEGLVMNNFWILCGLLERYGTVKAHAEATLTAHGRSQQAVAIGTRFPLAARALPGLLAATRSLRR